jgi:hypothetical protein
MLMISQHCANTAMLLLIAAAYLYRRSARLLFQLVFAGALPL